MHDVIKVLTTWLFERISDWCQSSDMFNRPWKIRHERSSHSYDRARWQSHRGLTGSYASFNVNLKLIYCARVIPSPFSKECHVTVYESGLQTQWKKIVTNRREIMKARARRKSNRRTRFFWSSMRISYVIVNIQISHSDIMKIFFFFLEREYVIMRFILCNLISSSFICSRSVKMLWLCGTHV